MGDVGRFVGSHTFPCHEYCWYVCLMLTNNYPVHVGKIWLTHNLSTWIYMDGFEAPVVPGLKPLAPLITRDITYLVLRLSLKKGGGGTWALAHLFKPASQFALFPRCRSIFGSRRSSPHKFQGIGRTGCTGVSLGPI